MDCAANLSFGSETEKKFGEIILKIFLYRTLERTSSEILVISLGGDKGFRLVAQIEVEPKLLRL